jgi:hypothetical protein
MRNSMRRCGANSAFLALSSCWTVTAHCTACTTLGNSASRLSPGESTTRPRCCWIRVAISSRYAVMVWMVATSSSPMRRLYPLTSVLKIAASFRSMVQASSTGSRPYVGRSRQPRLNNPPGYRAGVGTPPCPSGLSDRMRRSRPPGTRRSRLPAGRPPRSTCCKTARLR